MKAFGWASEASLASNTSTSDRSSSELLSSKGPIYR